jgi:hypothetical protein
MLGLGHNGEIWKVAHIRECGRISPFMVRSASGAIPATRDRKYRAAGRIALMNKSGSVKFRITFLKST